MKRSKDVNHVINKLIFKYKFVYPKFRCSYCPPNRGCNRVHKRIDNSWKSHRKTQYKQ